MQREEPGIVLFGTFDCFVRACCDNVDPSVGTKMFVNMTGLVCGEDCSRSALRLSTQNPQLELSLTRYDDKYIDLRQEQPVCPLRAV